VVGQWGNPDWECAFVGEGNLAGRNTAHGGTKGQSGEDDGGKLHSVAVAVAVAVGLRLIGGWTGKICI
jgi:hypothetical protein